MIPRCPANFPGHNAPATMDKADRQGTGTLQKQKHPRPWGRGCFLP